MKEQPFTKEKIAQFFEGTLPELEHTAILSWFSSLNEDDQLAFMDTHLAVMEQSATVHSLIPAGGFQKIEHQILHKKRLTLQTGYSILKIAAVVLPFLLGYLFIQQPYTAPKKSPVLDIAAVIRTIKINNPEQAIKEIRLPDLSIVSLYPGATISYAQGFKGKNRDMQLSGKAFFKVKHDRHRPFTVQTGAITTVVLGTSFWIDAGKDAKKISVKVKTGKVGVIHGHQPAIFLFPSETAIFNTLTGVLAKVKQPVNRIQPLLRSEEAPAALVFNATPLKQVMNALAENFKLNISIQDSINTDLPVSLNTKGKTVPEILQQIKSQTPIDYAIKDKKIIIRKQQ